jgi:hypothetical protein
MMQQGGRLKTLFIWLGVACASALCGAGSRAADLVTTHGLVTAPAAPAPTVPSAAQPTAAGWQILFDGTDLSAWRNFKGQGSHPHWQIVDGALTLTAAGGGDLLSKQQYANFELELSWLISTAGNSGVFILADEQGQFVYSHAPEIQILDNERHADNKLASHRSGSLYDLIAAPASAQKPAGQWNQLRIIHQNGHLQVWQNGLATVDIQLGSPRWQQLVAASKFAGWSGFAANRQGHIGLQDHGDRVSFKHIRIRELP